MNPVVALVPRPRSLEVGAGAPFLPRPDAVVRIDPPSAAVEAVAHVLAGELASPGGEPLRVVADADAAPADGDLVLRLVPGIPREGYRLSVDGAVTIDASDAAGLFYGTRTLRQLRGVDAATPVPSVHIEDEPRFRYRGFMLDVARHFFPVETICRLIDRAADLKLNHLHLHLTDDQGWRLALTTRPRLTERASSSEVGGGRGGSFTAHEFRRIVSYAASRHMTVVPEIDVPGHTHAVGLAYPRIAADPVIGDHLPEEAAARGEELPRAGAAYTGTAVGFSSLRVDEEETERFLEDVFGELAELTPGPYLHVGGDEALGTSTEDYARFIARVTRIVVATGKTPIAWHEAGAAADLSPGTIGQYWGMTVPTAGADARARAFVRGGGRVILSPADATYLDMKTHAGQEIGLSWANGPTSLERAYRWEPSAVIPDIAEEDILGVEAPLWTETVQSVADIDQLMFPRVAAAAERAWSPRTPDENEAWSSFHRRVGHLRPHWRADGVHLAAAIDEERTR